MQAGIKRLQGIMPTFLLGKLEHISRNSATTHMTEKLQFSLSNDAGLEFPVHPACLVAFSSPGGGKGWHGAAWQGGIHGVRPAHALCPLLPLVAEAFGLLCITC